MINFSDIEEHFKTTDKLRAAGDVLQYVLPAVALVLIAFTGNVADVWNWLTVVLVSAVVVYVMKNVFNRTALGIRPDGTGKSFPSSHSSSAFTGAWTIVAVFGWQWGLLAVAVAAFVAYTRVVAAKHHWRDVIASAVITAIVTQQVFM